MGPLFSNDKGRPMKVSELDVHFHSILSEVQKRFPTVIPPGVTVEDDYSCSLSIRCGATSEALNVNIPPAVIDANNRWRKRQRSKGLVPGWTMVQHYTDAKVAIPLLLQFSSKLPS